MVLGLPYGRKLSELFKVCGLGDGYKAAKTRETHISEDFYEKKASESTKKALCPKPRPSRSRAAGERLGPQEGSERGKKTLLKNLLEKPCWKTSLKFLDAVLDGLGRPWRAAKALRKPLGRILGQSWSFLEQS